MPVTGNVEAVFIFGRTEVFPVAGCTGSYAEPANSRDCTRDNGAPVEERAVVAASNAASSSELLFFICCYCFEK